MSDGSAEHVIAQGKGDLLWRSVHHVIRAETRELTSTVADGFFKGERKTGRKEANKESERDQKIEERLSAAVKGRKLTAMASIATRRERQTV